MKIHFSFQSQDSREKEKYLHGFCCCLPSSSSYCYQREMFFRVCFIFILCFYTHSSCSMRLCKFDSLSALEAKCSLPSLSPFFLPQNRFFKRLFENTEKKHIKIKKYKILLKRISSLTTRNEIQIMLRNKKKSSLIVLGLMCSVFQWFFDFIAQSKQLHHHQSLEILLNLKFNKRKFHSSNHDNHSDRIEYRNTFRCGFLISPHLIHCCCCCCCTQKLTLLLLLLLLFCFLSWFLLKIYVSSTTDRENFPHPIRLFTVWFLGLFIVSSSSTDTRLKRSRENKNTRWTRTEKRNWRYHKTQFQGVKQFPIELISFRISLFHHHHHHHLIPHNSQ